MIFQSGLTYKKEAEVNWDPVDKTVLASEQVIDGRDGDQVLLLKRRSYPIVLKISSYSDELLKDLDNLQNWPNKVKVMQSNWIGKSVGAEIILVLENK